MIEYKTEQRAVMWGVAFGHGSWVYVDFLGLIDPLLSEFDPHDRGFKATALEHLRKALIHARTAAPGPYGKPGSAARRKLCEVAARLATDKSREMDR